jgi:hypothetical protein
MTMPKKPLSEMTGDELVAEAYEFAESAKEWSHGQEVQRANDIAFAQLLLHFAEYQRSQFFKRFTQYGTITGRITPGQMPPENWQTMSPEARRERTRLLYTGGSDEYSVDDIQIDDGTGVKRSISNEEVMADEEDVDS